MPDFALFDLCFQGMSVEGAYDALLEDERPCLNRDPKDLRYGAEGWWDALEGRERDAYYRSAIQRRLVYGEGSGRNLLPAGLVEEIRALSHPHPVGCGAGAVV